MGRGRQKAKHTKLARELKYTVPETNYNALERELAGSRPHEDERAEDGSVEDLSKWADYMDDDAHDDDEADELPHQRRA